MQFPSVGSVLGGPAGRVSGQKPGGRDTCKYLGMLVGLCSRRGRAKGTGDRVLLLGMPRRTQQVGDWGIGVSPISSGWCGLIIGCTEGEVGLIIAGFAGRTRQTGICGWRGPIWWSLMATGLWECR